MKLIQWDVMMKDKSCIVLFCIFLGSSVFRGVSGCGPVQADLVLLISESANIGPANYAKQLAFINSLIDTLPIGSDEVRVGAVTFNKNPTLQFDLTTHTTSSDLKNAITNLGYGKGATNVDDAVYFIRDSFFTAANGDRTDASNYLLLMTDGISSGDAAAGQAATAAGITVYAIGVAISDTQELIDLAAPRADFVFFTADYDALTTITSDVADVLPCPFFCGEWRISYDFPINLAANHDTSANAMYLLNDAVYDVPCCTVISGWEFHAATSGDVTIMVWREQGTSYELVGTNNITVTAGEVGTVKNYTVPAGQRIAMIKGDRFGWFCSGTNIISHGTCTTGTNTRCPQNTLKLTPSGTPNIGDVIDWSGSGSSLSDRALMHYLLTRQTVNSAPTLTNVVYDSSIPDNTPTGASILSFTITDVDVADEISYNFTHSYFTLDTNLMKVTLNSAFPLDGSLSESTVTLVAFDTCRNTVSTTYKITIETVSTTTSITTTTTIAAATGITTTTASAIATTTAGSGVQTSTSSASQTGTTTVTESTTSSVTQSGSGTATTSNTGSGVTSVTESTTSSVTQSGSGTATTSNTGSGTTSVTESSTSSTVSTTTELVTTTTTTLSTTTLSTTTTQMITTPRIDYDNLTGRCGPVKADIIMLIDESGSVRESHFRKQLAFCNTLIDSLKIGPDEIRVGAVTFAHDTTFRFALDAHTTSTDLKTAISNITKRPGGTDIALAIDYVKDTYLTSANGDRPEASDYILLITDGTSLGAASAGQAAIAAGITMWVVGIGDEVEPYKQELIDIVTPRDDYFFFADDFDDLANIAPAVAAVLPCPYFCSYWAVSFDYPSNLADFNDTTSNVMYMLNDAVYNVSCCAVISGWEFFPFTTGDVMMMLWRPRGSTYELIESNTITVTASDVGKVYNYSVPLGRRISLVAGDRLGWYCPGGNIISYGECNTTVNEKCPQNTLTVTPSGTPTPGMTVDWEGTGSVIADRGYAILGYTENNTALTLEDVEYNSSLSDIITVGSPVVTFNLTEVDLADEITYNFSHSYFTLNETANEITLTTALPRDNSLGLQIIPFIAYDTCEHTVSATFTISIYNALPTINNLPVTVSLSETTPNNTWLYDLDTSDASGDAVCCVLSEVIPHSDNFVLKYDNVTDVYSVHTSDNVQLGYWLATQYKLIFCCDDGHIHTKHTLTLKIPKKIKRTSVPGWVYLAVFMSLLPIWLCFAIAGTLLVITFLLEDFSI